LRTASIDRSGMGTFVKTKMEGLVQAWHAIGKSFKLGQQLR
jgi:hypothetical protein